MTHIQIYQVIRKIKITSRPLMIDWKRVLAGNCNCQILEACKATQIHTQTTILQRVQSKLSEMKSLTYFCNLRSMKILCQVKQLSNLKTVRMNILTEPHKHVYNIKDVAL